MRHLYLFLLLSIFSTGVNAGQQRVTEVISLGYRSVNEIVPLIRPMVTPGGSVSGLSGQLVVTATAQQMAEVRKVLQTLDKAPARLLISVKRGNSRTARQDSASIQGRTGNLSVNSGDLTIGRRDHERNHIKDSNGLSLRMKSNRQTENEQNIQQVQVLEGREAFISAGEEVPVRSRGVVIGRGGAYGYDNTEYYPAVTGFYAIPRLNGDEVFLDISTVSRKRKPSTGNMHHSNLGTGAEFAVANMQTSARGKLGEWIAIGAVNQSASSRLRGIGSTGQQQQDAEAQIFVKVEEIKGSNR